MHSIRSTMMAFILGIFTLAWVSRADRLPVPVERPEPPGGVRILTQNSGYEFAGTVTAVEHISPSGRSIGKTRITFHVDTAVRGVVRGQTLVISEWAGLWASGERYRVGERVFLFLYPPSKLGLTSPVRGVAGKFRLGEGGRVVIHPEQKRILPDRVAQRIGDRREIEIHEFTRALRLADKE